MSKLLYYHIDNVSAEEITITFLPFLVGVYPYTSVTDKMKKAIEKANFKYSYYTEKELIKMGLENILGGIK